MSKTHHSSAKHEHVATRSYVIGFILSLIFTAIPYYLVVNGTFSSSVLLAVILEIAVVQMLVQIFFFLHLGRGPKPLYNVAFFGGTVVTILVVVGGSIVIMNNLHYMAPTEVSKNLIEKEGIYQISGEKTGACQGVHTNHKVTIIDGKVSPLHTNAKLCDTLSFINEDEPREMTFGTHPAHDSYGGQSELTVRKGRAKVITLNELGSYRFHDHNDPTVGGSFVVSE